MDIAYSVNGVPIRLTEERWFHITERHDDVAGFYDECLRTIEDPGLVRRGYGGALIAVRGVARRQYLHVVYREIHRDDGFVLTAYFTSKLNRSGVVWQGAG